MEDERKGGFRSEILISLNLILLVYFIYISVIRPVSVKAVLVKPPPPVAPRKVGPIKAEKRSFELSLDSIEVIGQFRDLIKREELEKAVHVSTDLDDIILNFSDKVLFGPGSADMGPEAIDLLDKISEVIAESSRRVRIEGHTDNIPMSGGRYHSNWELSSGRAVAVLQYLNEVWEIPEGRLSAAGFAQYQPRASNDTAEGKAQNRRVSIVLVGRDDIGE